MATSKSRGSGGSGNSKSASKKSAPAKKSSASSSAASKSGRGGAAQKKSAAPKKAATASSASKKSTASTRGGTVAAAKKAAASRNSITGKSAGVGGRGGASATTDRSSAARSIASSRNASSARGGASSKAKVKSADPRNDLEKILQDLMQDIYYAEKKLTKALGKMSKVATDTKLKEAFLTHQGQTEEQIARLEEAFGLLGQKPKSKKCAAMDGLIEEGNEHIEELARGAGLDAALIVGAQKIEHYEIAAYGSMRSFARTLGYSEAATIFEEIREQESDTDELLTNIAESVVNLRAEGETEDVKGSSGNADADGGMVNSSSRGSEDSDAGEDSSSAVSGRSEGNSDSDDNGNDGAGRGISALTDGADRGESSETGEPMGY